MLRPLQINVLVAHRPSEALQVAESGPVHLLISDVAMPEMDGVKLAERVLKLHPGASVLLISGKHREPPAAARAAQVRFLRKPFFPSQLLQSLREMLPDL